MADSPSLVTINDIVTRYLLKYKRSTDDAVIYTEHAAECIKAWHLYHGNEVNIEKTYIDANYIIWMPSDMIGFVDLCYYFNGRYWSMTEQKDIVSTMTGGMLLDERDADIQEGQPISHAVTYGYGGRGGVNAYNYNINWKERRIYVEGISSDYAILFYTSSGIVVNGATYVSDLLSTVIDSYLLYVETFWITNLVREREMRKKAYNEEVLRARNFVNALTYNQLRDIILGESTQGPKR